MNESLVIVGAGHAAGQLVAGLAQEGFAGAVTVIGEEPYPPYQRPPLSKKFLAGDVELDRLFVKPAAFYDKVGARLMLGTRVVAIDRQARAVTTDAGASLRYSSLVIATGSRPRRPEMQGAHLDGVFCLRTIADAQAIRARLVPGRRLVIVGGGYIGLELAAVVVRQGLDVTVLEQAPRLMARGVGPIVSAFYARLHAEEGVTVRTGVTVTAFEGGNHVEQVVCAGSRYAADIVGAGAVPNSELATDGGLAVADGILVDAHCRTSDPTVYAIGDCANQLEPTSGRRLRLESVHNALEQAKAAAAAICGRPSPPVQTPWFWSDQYDVKLQMAGISSGHTDIVTRGDPDRGRSFAVFYLRAGVVIAADAVNRVPEFMVSRQLIAERARLPLCRLGDETVAMKDVRG